MVWAGVDGGGVDGFEQEAIAGIWVSRNEELRRNRKEYRRKRNLTEMALNWKF